MSGRALRAAALVILLLPLPAHAQAVQLVTAIAQYVGLTAAFAEAVKGLAGAVRESYAAGLGIADDVGCRAQKGALGELVVELRELEREKTALHRSLRRAVNFPRGPADWRDVRSQAERVRVDIQALERMIAAEKATFAANPAVSRAYSELLISFDQKNQLIRDLVEEMAGVNWDWRQLDRFALEPHFLELERLEAELKDEVEAIAGATDVIAEHTQRLCTAAG